MQRNVTQSIPEHSYEKVRAGIYHVLVDGERIGQVWRVGRGWTRTGNKSIPIERSRHDAAVALLSTRVCSACGKDFVLDDDMLEMGHREYVPNCHCLQGPDCGKRFKEDDYDNGVSLASTDEEAAKYDPDDMGKCDACWTKVMKQCG